MNYVLRKTLILITLLFVAPPAECTTGRVISTSVVGDEIIWLLRGKDEKFLQNIFFSSLALNKNYSRIGHDPTLTGIKNFQTLGVGLNLEYLVSLKPTLVIANEFNRAEVFSTLNRFKIPTLKINDARTFDDVWKDVARIAESIGAQDSSATLIKNAKARLDASTHCADRSRYKQHSVLVYSPDFMFAGEDTLWAQIVGQIGLRNAISTLNKKGWAHLSDEVLLKMDVDLLVIPTTQDGEFPKIQRQLQQHPAWSRTKAVREQKLIPIDTSLLSTGSPYIVDLAEKMCRSFTQTPDPIHAKP